MKIFVVDDEGNFLREAETDEIGASASPGPTCFKGYLDEAHNKGHLAQGRAGSTPATWGGRTADGYFWLTGRKKELIIRGGHNIDPAAIEEPLYQMPGVQVAAAVGRPDPHAGEVPVAYVQLQEGTRWPSTDSRQVEKPLANGPPSPRRSSSWMKCRSRRWARYSSRPCAGTPPDGFTKTFSKTSGAWRPLLSQVVEDKIHGAVARIRIAPGENASPTGNRKQGG